MSPRPCKVCRKKFFGRTDKLFCSIHCKNYYHLELRKASKKQAVPIDRILHRNRSILLEIMGKSRNKMKISRIELEKKKFTFSYHTHSLLNKQGKVYFYIYDFAWMDFSDSEILLLHAKERKPKTTTFAELV